jgi:hypothetical protein
MIETKPVRGFPAWASTLIIIVALAGGAGIVYWFLTTGPGGNEVVVLDRGPLDGIKPLPGGRTWVVTAGNTTMRVAKLPGDKIQTKFGYLQYDFLTPAEFDVLNKGKRIASDAAVADAMGLSSQQADAIRDQVKRGFGIAISDADQQRLADLFRTWLSAPVAGRDGPELKLLRALDDMGDRTAAAARQVTTDAAAQIQKVVTEEQWQKFEQMDK